MNRYTGTDVDIKRCRLDDQIVDWTQFTPDAHLLLSVESLFGDFVFWLDFSEISLQCYTGGNNRNRKKRQLAHHCLGIFPDKDSVVKDVLDLNRGGKKIWSKREGCRK